MQAGNARPGLSARLIVGPAHRTPSVAPGQGGAGWLAARLASHPGRVRVTGPRKPGWLPPVAMEPFPAAPNFKLSLAVGVLLPMLIHVMIILV